MKHMVFASSPTEVIHFGFWEQRAPLLRGRVFAQKCFTGHTIFPLLTSSSLASYDTRNNLSPHAYNSHNNHHFIFHVWLFRHNLTIIRKAISKENRPQKQDKHKVSLKKGVRFSHHVPWRFTILTANYTGSRRRKRRVETSCRPRWWQLGLPTAGRFRIRKLRFRCTPCVPPCLHFLTRANSRAATTSDTEAPISELRPGLPILRWCHASKASWLQDLRRFPPSGSNRNSNLYKRWETGTTASTENPGRGNILCLLPRQSSRGSWHHRLPRPHHHHPQKKTSAPLCRKDCKINTKQQHRIRWLSLARVSWDRTEPLKTRNRSYQNNITSQEPCHHRPFVAPVWNHSSSLESSIREGRSHRRLHNRKTETFLFCFKQLHLRFLHKLHS